MIRILSELLAQSALVLLCSSCPRLVAKRSVHQSQTDGRPVFEGSPSLQSVRDNDHAPGNTSRAGEDVTSLETPRSVSYEGRLEASVL
jgi:hypothetical protein